ncbi:hypothetical protein Bca4012_039349 [Brassica carinata]
MYIRSSFVSSFSSALKNLKEDRVKKVCNCLIVSSIIICFQVYPAMLSVA